MKKLLLSFLIVMFAGGLSLVSADCMHEEVDPVCMINGETKTSTCQGWSDTSPRNTPDAYDGVCKEYPELSNITKKAIHMALLSIFKDDLYFKIEGVEIPVKKFSDVPSGMKYIAFFPDYYYGAFAITGDKKLSENTSLWEASPIIYNNAGIDTIHKKIFPGIARLMNEYAQEETEKNMKYLSILQGVVLEINGDYTLNEYVKD